MFLISFCEIGHEFQLSSLYVYMHNHSVEIKKRVSQDSIRKKSSSHVIFSLYSNFFPRLEYVFCVHEKNERQRQSMKCRKKKFVTVFFSLPSWVMVFCVCKLQFLEKKESHENIWSTGISIERRDLHKFFKLLYDDNKEKKLLMND